MARASKSPTSFASVATPIEKTIESTNVETKKPNNVDNKESSKEENNVTSKQPINESSKVAENVPTKEEKNEQTIEEKKKPTNEETKVQRKRVSFDIRVDLHKRLKVQSANLERNIYELIEEAIEKHLNELE